MELLTKAIEKEFERIGDQEHVTDPIVIVKYFNPCGAETWFATEYYPEDETCFGYICTQPDYNNEFGYFSLAEMRTVRLPLGLSIERDLYFSQKRLSEALKQIQAPMPSFWKRYIDYDVPQDINVEALLETLGNEIKEYAKAYGLSKDELRDLDEDSVNQSIYNVICFKMEILDWEELATDIMKYHFWDTLDEVTGGLYDTD